MKEIAIAASRRPELGKGAARQFRMAGKIPCVMYGPEIDAMPILIGERDFRSAMKASAGESSIFTLNVDGSPNKVVIREIQRDPVTSKIMHLDFHAISMNRPIHIRLAVHLVGTAKGVKSEGGIMQVLLRELEISCLPTNIPEHFQIDVSELGIGASIHVRDIALPNVEILNDPSTTIVVISAPTVIKAEAAATEPVEGEAAAAGAEGAAPTEEKKDEKKEEKKEEKPKKGK